MQSFIQDPNIYVSNGNNFILKNRDTSYKGDIADNKEAKKRLKAANKNMDDLQRMLYANDNHSVLIVFQAMDAAGKDSTIRAVFSGLNPTGFQVSSFKAPSKKELDHDYLWRTQMALPERGRIAIFNRSHYEEVLVCKVHPEYVLGQNIPSITELDHLDTVFWDSRYEQIRNWEKHLAQNGTLILKFLLNVSKEEQKRRFISRIEEQEKNWKFSLGDVHERGHWDTYMDAYQKAIASTSAPHAPWFVIPADDKKIMRCMVAEIVAEALQSLDLNYPNVGAKAMEEIKAGKDMLENEN